MSSRTLASAARAEGSNSLLSLLVVYSTTTLMISAVCLMVSLLVIDPHTTDAGVSPHEITLPRSGKEAMQAGTTKTEPSEALVTSQVDAPGAGGSTQFTQTSKHIYDG